jgi:predicted nuclease with TOPRIM domain
LPALAKATALAEKTQKRANTVQPRSTTPKEVKKGPNVEAMKNTLAALKEEKSTLEEKLKRNKTDTDLQFELELVTKNIATLTEKITKA